MPNKSHLRKEYFTRINRVMDHISRNLDQVLDLETLSRVACFSPYHFHRIFAALAGETLGDHIRRIRLERAAGQLAMSPDMTVTEAAMACGFSSPSVFARAFKQHFGVSASQWQKAGSRDKSKKGKTKSNDGQAQSNEGKEGKPFLGYNPVVNKATNTKRRVPVKVEIKQLPPYHVAYMRYIGPYGPGVSHHWEGFRKWARAHNVLGKGAIDPIALGISHDDPSITPLDKCRYDSCAVVPADFKPGPGINTADIPGGKYAVHRFRGTDRDIGKAWNEIYAVWLPDSGYQCGDGPCFELYTNQHDCHPDGSWECDICIPVKPM